MGDSIDGYIENKQQIRLLITLVQNVLMQRVQDVKMQREDSARLQREKENYASEGVITTKIAEILSLSLYP